MNTTFVHWVLARLVASRTVTAGQLATLSGAGAELARRVRAANGEGPDAAFLAALSEVVADEAEREAWLTGVSAQDPDADPPADNPQHASQPSQAPGGSLPAVVASGRQLRDVASDVIAALVGINDPPTLFVRDGRLARITVNEAGKARIEQLKESALRGIMTRAADFATVDPKGNVKNVSPPLDVVRDLLELEGLPFPGLAGLIEAPALRPDGSVITEPGYDPATGLYHRPAAGLIVPLVPTNPTRAEMDAALQLLREPFVDFPYVAEADRTNALALAMTPILRPAIPGPVPLALVSATQQGTGKGLHAEVTSHIASGRAATMAPLAKDEELQKQLYANLLAGEALITFDNVDGRIYSPVLARFLTATEIGGRILGESSAPSLPQRATWIATGNAIQLGGDLARRCYPINLDAKMSNPWERVGFRHPDLLEWVGTHRGQLIGAILTLARGWWAAGRPAAKSPVIGSFEPWCRVLGGILEHADARDFLGNLRTMYETADEEGRQWESFILAAAGKTAGPVTIAELCKAIEQDATLLEVVPDIGEEPTDSKGAIRPKFKQMLGIVMRKRIGRRHGRNQARIEREDSQARVARWLFKVG